MDSIFFADISHDYLIVPLEIALDIAKERLGWIVNNLIIMKTIHH